MSTSPTSASSQMRSHPLNAQVVLDQTRRELRDFLIGEPTATKAGHNGNATKGSPATAPGNAHASHSSTNCKGHQRSSNNDASTIDWMGLVKAGAATWWRDHPLHMGATVLHPVVADCVRRKPVATLAVAATAGAALVLFRPWRMASVAALGMSLVRSSNLPVMAASLVATVAENLQKERV